MIGEHKLIERHFGGTLSCRVEPIFEVLDSDPVFDLRLVDGHHDACGTSSDALAAARKATTRSAASEPRSVARAPDPSRCYTDRGG